MSGITTELLSERGCSPKYHAYVSAVLVAVNVVLLPSHSVVSPSTTSVVSMGTGRVVSSKLTMLSQPTALVTVSVCLLVPTSVGVISKPLSLYVSPKVMVSLMSTRSTRLIRSAISRVRVVAGEPSGVHVATKRIV